jgi:hypothetical protein
MQWGYAFPIGTVNLTSVPPSAPGLNVQLPPLSSSRLRMLFKPFRIWAALGSIPAIPLPLSSISKTKLPGSRRNRIYTDVAFA